jgi:hypothetical protein
MANSGENMNKSLQKYEKGFYYSTNDAYRSFWVGLQVLPLLLGPNPRTIRIDILSTGPETISHRYKGVVIGDASTKSRFSYQGHTSNGSRADGNCLEISNMTSFSTTEQDNDGDNSENWAMIARAGWWFPAFNFTCNPLGGFYGYSSPTIRFPGFTSGDLSALKGVEMVIEEDDI